MIYFLFCLGCIVSYLCYKHKSNLEAAGDSKSLRFIFLTNALEVLLPFTAVSFLYSILAFLVRDMGTDKVTLESLRAYEKLIQSVQEWMKYLKLSPLHSLLLVLVWFLVAMVARWLLFERGSERIEKAYPYFEKYNKWLKRVSLVVTILASFTFFGSQVDSKARLLQAHIKTMKDNHHAFYSEMGQAIKSSISNQIYQDIASSAPRTYAQLTSFNKKLDDEFAELMKRYKWARDNYSTETIELKTLDGKLSQREKRIGQLIEEIEKHNVAKSNAPPDLEKRAKYITNRKLTQLREAVRSYSRNLAARVKPVLQTPLGKQLLPTMLGALISHDNIPAFGALAEEIPSFKAIFPTITKTINKKLETQANALIHELAEKALTQQGVNWEAEVKSGVEGMLKNNPINSAEVSQEAIAETADLLERQKRRLRPASEQLNRTLESARAKMRNQNRALATEVENRWQTLRKSYSGSYTPDLTDRPLISDEVLELMRKKRAPLTRTGDADKAIADLLEQIRKSKSPITADFDDAFKALTKEIQAIAEPIEQQKVLQSALNNLNKATSLEQAVTGMREVAATHFPNSSVIGRISRIRERMRPPISGPFITPRLPIPPIKPPPTPWWKNMWKRTPRR